MIVFDLEKQKCEMINCSLNHGILQNKNRGYFKGEIKDLPQEYTLLYGIQIFENQGNNTTLFEFGSYQQNTGYGLFINPNKEIAFRVNRDYENYSIINTCFRLNEFIEIKIIKTKKDLSLYIDNELKYKTLLTINKFNNYGGFSRAHAGGNTGQFISGIITPIKIYDEIIENSTQYFEKIKENLIKCPNCNRYGFDIQTITFNPRPQGNEETDHNDTIIYNKCISCGTIFSDEMMSWSPEKFKEKCYNDNYLYYDMDIILPYGERTILAKQHICNNYNKNICHLDYGGNKGFLQNLLKSNGFNETYIYDPFTENNDKEILNRKYDLITCFEVIEHAYNINEIFKLFKNILNKNGKVVFTTCLYNNENLNEWWYCNPRVGHILFFTKQGIESFVNKHGFEIQSIERFQNQNIITIKKINDIRINSSDAKKIVDYFEDGGSYLISMDFHGFGDVIMVYPIFKKLQKIYPKCTIDFRGRMGQEYFNSITKSDYDIVFKLIFPEPNDRSKVERCCLEEIGIPFTKDIDYTFKPLHKIGKIIGVNFVVDSNSSRNLNYDKAKKVWDKIKEMGYIPLEIIFYHKGAKYRSEKYDFIDFTTRDIKAEPETTFNMIASCDAFIGVNSGTLVAASAMYPKKCLHLNTSISFSNYKKFNPIKEIDCHGSIDLKELEDFIKNLQEKND